MTITITRQYKKPTYIIGSMSIDGAWFCNTLEPREGSDKESVTTGSGVAIKPGKYEVKIMWSPKFVKYLPGLVNVEGREGILIHSGNSARDTRGCILLGKNTRPGRVLQSKEMLNQFINKLRKAQSKGEEVTITII